MFDPRNLPNWLKLGTKPLLAVALATGVVLFAPQSWTAALGLGQLASEYRPWLGGAFLLSSALVTVNGGARTWRWWQERRQHQELRQKRIERLHNLAPQEKEILRAYIAERTRTKKISVLNETATALTRAGILRQTSSIGTLYGHPFTVADWAWGYLHEHPELLE